MYQASGGSAVGRSTYKVCQFGLGTLDLLPRLIYHLLDLALVFRAGLHAQDAI